MEDNCDMTPRVKGQPTKRKGDDGGRTAPDQVGEGLFKSGTPHMNGIFRCPADVQFDTQDGRNQSEVLDKLAEALERIYKIRQEITGEVTDPMLHQWEYVASTAAASHITAAGSASRVKRARDENSHDPTI